MDRGYDQLVDFFGADHHGYVPRLKASIAALGNDPDKLSVDIIQMVRLVENGQEVKMSKRLGNAVTIRESFAMRSCRCGTLFLCAKSTGYAS